MYFSDKIAVTIWLICIYDILMIQVLIIEDEKRVAQLTQKGLIQLGYKVDVAYDGDEGLIKFNEGNIDLVICDIMLPTINGLEVSKRIRQNDKLTPILMLTALGTTDDKLEGFDSGADDYMVKPFDLRELDARIKVLLRRKLEQNDTNKQTNSYQDLTLNDDEKIAIRDGVKIKLSPKEYQLLHYMVANAERVLSRTEIAEKVWETYFDTGTNFIDVYVSYLRNKVDKPFATKLIHTRPGLGFILTSQP